MKFFKTWWLFLISRTSVNLIIVNMQNLCHMLVKTVMIHTNSGVHPVVMCPTQLCVHPVIMCPTKLCVHTVVMCPTQFCVHTVVVCPTQLCQEWRKQSTIIQLLNIHTIRTWPDLHVCKKDCWQLECRNTLVGILTGCSKLALQLMLRCKWQSEE